MEPQVPHFAPSHDESVLVAQYRMLANNMPLMYVVHIVCGLLVGALYSNVAPPELVFPLMTLLMGVALLRLCYWLNPRLAETESLARIRSTVKVAPAFAVMFHGLISIWVLLIVPYGDESHQLLVAFYLAMTTFCGITFNANLLHCVSAILITGSVPLVGGLIYMGTEPALMFAAIYVANTSIQVVAVRHQHRDLVYTLRLKFAADASRSDAEAARRDIARVADTDALSGLPNRRSLLNTISAQLNQHPAQPFSFGLIDLDGFKPVNDLYGHTAGDEVINAVANRLRLVIEPHGSVARFGGDEFGFILSDAQDIDDVRKRVAELISVVEEPINLEDVGTVQISACCGVSRYPEMAATFKELFQRADEALYAAKSLGHGSTMLYDQQLQSKQNRRRHIEMRMRIAISNREFDLAFQPIRDLNSGRVSSYEALARWNDAELGTVSPAEFIPIAEQCGLISALSDVLLERALLEASNWPQDVSLSFNLSPVQIHNLGFALHTLSLLSKHRFPAERLMFEVTETALLTDIDRAAEVIQQLRGAGIRVALDDFGVGFAGFGYLSRLTLDKLKIDRSFVSGMEDDVRKGQIIKAIVEMCHSLQIKCIAEGVESDAELMLLKSFGCDAAQGYLLGRPGLVPGSRIEEGNRAATS